MAERGLITRTSPGLTLLAQFDTAASNLLDNGRDSDIYIGVIAVLRKVISHLT